MLHKPWFKWIIIGSSFLMIGLVALVFFIKEAQRQAEIELKKQNQLREIADYRARYRSAVVRTLQNLQLDNFLAAYQIMKDLPAPPSLLKNETREYYDLIVRISRGLLNDRFIKEAQAGYERLLNVPDYDPIAREALSEIAANYRLRSARSFLADSKQLIREGLWRDAQNELSKANLEFESVRLFGKYDVSEEIAEVKQLMQIARHQVHVQSAKLDIQDAERFLASNNFQDLQAAMSRASQHVGRAAFYDSEAPVIEELRQKLFDLEAEFAYRVPNLIPIYNYYEKKQADVAEDYFHLSNYEFDISELDDLKINLQLVYDVRQTMQDYFVLRYKIFFHDGRQFFNGFYLEAEKNGQLHRKRKLFEQEVPQVFHSIPVKRIEVEVYNQANQRISYLTRSFRRPEQGS